MPIRQAALKLQSLQLFILKSGAKYSLNILANETYLAAYFHIRDNMGLPIENGLICDVHVFLHFSTLEICERVADFDKKVRDWIKLDKLDSTQFVTTANGARYKIS